MYRETIIYRVIGRNYLRDEIRELPNQQQLRQTA